ncbi:unnamed protein product [Cunninghamella echinulata]
MALLQHFLITSLHKAKIPNMYIAIKHDEAVIFRQRVEESYSRNYVNNANYISQSDYEIDEPMVIDIDRLCSAKEYVSTQIYIGYYLIKNYKMTFKIYLAAVLVLTLFSKKKKNTEHIAAPLQNKDIDITLIENFPVSIAEFLKVTSTKPLTLFYRNIKDICEVIFSTPFLWSCMYLNPIGATRNGDIVYDDVCSSKILRNVQSKFDPSFGLIMLVIMLASYQTVVTGSFRNKAWPLYMTLGTYTNNNNNNNNNNN